MLQDQRGMTLLETVLALGLFAGLIVAVLSILSLGQSSNYFATQSTESAQQLQLAMRQISSDLTFSQWANPAGASETDFAVLGYVPRVSKTADAAFWTADRTAWPGDLTGWTSVRIRYVLDGQSLLRQVIDPSSNAPFGQQVVATNLVPYAGNQSGSYIAVDTGKHLIKVMLRVTRKEAKSDAGFAEAYSEFYVR